MVIDGKAIASDIYREIKNSISHLGQVPHLTVFTCEPNFETQKYLALKRRKAVEVGIPVNVIEFPSSITTDEVIQTIKHAVMQTDGIIVQLPLPTHLEVDQVLKAIPKHLDIDALGYEGGDSLVLPPVVGAVKEIAARHHLDWLGKQVVVVGQGLLVGRPAALWARAVGANVSVVTKETVDIDVHLAAADIIISGAGQPGLIKSEKVKSGVVIFDAGTSEEGGVLKGDVDVDVADKAALFTPVPGGIGPVTIAVLLRNLVDLAHVQNR